MLDVLESVNFFVFTRIVLASVFSWTQNNFRIFSWFVKRLNVLMRIHFVLGFYREPFTFWVKVTYIVTWYFLLTLFDSKQQFFVSACFIQKSLISSIATPSRIVCSEWSRKSLYSRNNWVSMKKGEKHLRAIGRPVSSRIITVLSVSSSKTPC